VLVGREAEAGVLEGAFEAAAGGMPQLVLVGAEAGGAKSRLVSELPPPECGTGRSCWPGERTPHATPGEPGSSQARQA
jgi:hypothetical protein